MKLIIYLHFIFMKECDLKIHSNSLRYLSFTSFMRNLQNVHLKNSCIAPEKLQLQTIAKQKSTLWRVADVFRQTSLTNVPNNHYETIIYYRKIFSSFHLEIYSFFVSKIGLTYCEKNLFLGSRRNFWNFWDQKNNLFESMRGHNNSLNRIPCFLK